jgi:uncharacterized membrane protein
MRVIWTILKVVIGLALVIPISIIALATALGILGALIGVAILSLKLAVLALIGWGVFRLLARLLGGPSKSTPHTVQSLPPVDPHYEAAMRELDRELGGTSR